MKDQTAIFWHRRDLRLTDNAGLYHALKSGYAVLPVFIFDKHILDGLENKADARVEFIHTALLRLKQAYEKLGSSIRIFYDTPENVFKILCREYDVQAVFTNRDYEPYAQARDKNIFTFLDKKGIPFKGFKDHVIFEKSEVIKDDGKPYTVFTPYSKKWKQVLNDFYTKPYPVEKYTCHLLKVNPFGYPALADLGFTQAGITFPPVKASEKIIRDYESTRDIPSINGTTRMSVHLRFGTVSIRQLAGMALTLNEKYLNELIWRDFYQAILYHYPHTVSRCFKPAYDKIEWRNNKTEFELWCAGKTGYPIVDAGMRELDKTGFMHNRVRMIVSSFLTRHLLIDWRWGEAWFAKKLLDIELASNIGGWQWAAGCGCDAAPYFRVFNPALQTQKFDPDMKYIKKWVPEINTPAYPQPVVEHSFARSRVLEIFKRTLNA